MKAKRMGRPPLAKAMRKGERLSVRLTRDEMRAAERAAKTARVPLSDWVRDVVLVASSSSPSGVGEASAREVVHGVETACYDNLPTQHPVMFCLCGKRVQGFNWEECGGEFDDHLKEAEHGKRGAK